MSVPLIHVIDVDDGPDGGGGPALLRALGARGVESRAYAFDALSSGFESATDVRLLDPEAPAPAIAGLFGSNDVVIPATPRALEWLDRISSSATKALPATLRAQLEAPRHVKALQRGRGSIPVPEHEIFQRAADRGAIAGTFAGGYLLARSGRIRAIGSGEELWFQLRGLERRGDLPAAAIAAARTPLCAFALLIRDGRLFASRALAADSFHDHGRIALGRTLAGDSWRAFAELAASFLGADGLYHGFALPPEVRAPARLVSVRPGPPTWLEASGADGGGLCAGLLGLGPGDAGTATAGADHGSGIYCAAVPVDRPIRPHELIQRIKHHV